MNQTRQLIESITTDLLHYQRGGEALSPTPVRMVECGCCDHHHRADFLGDCRNDAQRFIQQDDPSLPSDYTDEDGERWLSMAELHKETSS